MENGMDLSVEMSTMIATYFATGLVRSGVATREQASEILQEVADGLRQLDQDFPDEFKTNLRAANYLATARRMADLMRARAAAILQWNL
jgi:hypothetical protein